MDALFYVASSYEKVGARAKAKGLYTKILSMSGDDNPVHRKARKALQHLEGRA